MNRKKNYIQFLKYSAIAICVSSILSGCFLGSDEKQAPKAQVVAPITVSTYKIVPKDITVSLEYPAKIKSVKQVNVVARVSGILENKYFTEGSYVKEGDLLY